MNCLPAQTRMIPPDTLLTTTYHRHYPINKMAALDLFQTIHDLFHLSLDPIFTASFLKTMSTNDLAVLDANLPEMPDYELSEKMIS